MNRRKIILKIMLWSLGAAAGMGVLAVLLPMRDAMVRASFTAVVTAIAAGLMFPLSSMVDRAKSRTAGLFGMAAVIIEFILLLALIWIVDTRLFGSDFDERVGLTSLFVALTAVPATVFVRMLSTGRARLAGRVGLAVTAAGLLLFLTATYLPGSLYLHDEWWESGWSVYGFGLLCALCMVSHGFDRYYWRWVGVAFGALACAIALLDAWSSDFTVSADVLVAIASVSVVAAHANLVLLVPLKPGQGWLRLGTIAAGLATAAFVDIAVLMDASPDDYVIRFAAATGIVAACGSLAMLVLARFNRRVDPETFSTEVAEVTLVCPRCSRKQTISTGTSDCVCCGLRFDLRIEEPRCPNCEYLLYGLTSATCPECGTPVGQADAAGSTATGDNA